MRCAAFYPSRHCTPAMQATQSRFHASYHGDRVRKSLLSPAPALANHDSSPLLSSRSIASRSANRTTCLTYVCHAQQVSCDRSWSCPINLDFRLRRRSCHSGYQSFFPGGPLHHACGPTAMITNGPNSICRQYRICRPFFQTAFKAITLRRRASTAPDRRTPVSRNARITIQLRRRRPIYTATGGTSSTAQQFNSICAREPLKNRSERRECEAHGAQEPRHIT
jgi:hypothetical protein